VAEVVVGVGLGFAGLESPAHKADMSDPAEIGMRKTGTETFFSCFPAFLIQKAGGFSMTLEQRQGAQEKRKARRLCAFRFAWRLH